MGFSIKWRHSIKACLTSAHTFMFVNGSHTSESRVEKGIRQGDPLSPSPFILVLEVINVVLIDAKNKNLFHGIEVGKEKVQVYHLQFLDDALIFGEWSKPNI